jgi:cobalt-zinc-cadmium efflux system protein
LGIAINTATALLFMSGRKGDLNVKGAFIHMAADAAVSAGVVVAGAVIFYTGWQWLDPVTSLAINAIIVWGTWGLLRDSTNLALDAVRTTQTALTVHLVKPDAEIDDGLLSRACNELRKKFGIAHSTIQLERGDAAHPCQLAPEHVI